MEVNDFPNLPVRNVMKDNASFVLSENQLNKFDSLKLTEDEAIEIEENTRNQSKDPKWHKLRHSRITALTAGETAKRRAGITIDLFCLFAHLLWYIIIMLYVEVKQTL